MSIELMPPAIPPMPVTVAMAFLGNMSLTVVYILADQDWCAAQPRPMSTTGNHGESVPNGCAKSTTSGTNAKMSMALMRAA